MIAENVIGSTDDPRFAGRPVEYVDVSWHDAFKKIHRFTLPSGTELGVRFGDEILRHGLRQGDVLAEDGRSVVAVNIPAADVIRIRVRSDHPGNIAKVCYEIGNCHAALFRGTDAFEIVTPYTEPMLKLLSGIHGVSADRASLCLDFDRSVSNPAGGHSHGHSH